MEYAWIEESGFLSPSVEDVDVQVRPILKIIQVPKSDVSRYFSWEKRFPYKTILYITYLPTFS